MALRSDISGLSDTQFSDLLDTIGGKKPKQTKKPAPKKTPLPADDRPVTRIAHLLRIKLGFSDAQAVLALRDILIADGVRAELIPTPAEPLEAWLDLLLYQVSDSKVMTAAKQITPRSR